MTVLVLETFAIEGRASGRCSEQKTTATTIPQCPDLVSNALETEHRVEDVEGQGHLGVCRVTGRRGDHCRKRTRFSETFLKNLSVGLFGVRKQQRMINRFIFLTTRSVDPDLLEESLHAEGSRFIGEDRNDPLADIIGLEEISE